jgi:hypothetical protein
MTTTNVSQVVHSTTDTIITTGATLATGSFLNSGTAGAINNIPVIGTTVSYDLMDVFINFGSILVTGTAATNVQIACLDSPDGGTTFVSPGTAAAAVGDLNLVQSYPFAASTTIGPVVELPNVQIRPYDFVTLFQNNTGVTWPIGTVITAVRKSIANW